MQTRKTYCRDSLQEKLKGKHLPAPPTTSMNSKQTSTFFGITKKPTENFVNCDDQIALADQISFPKPK